MATDGQHWSIDMLHEHELETVVIPQWAVAAIVNNDYSGLDDDDRALIEAWLEAKAEKHGMGDIDADGGSECPQFYYANDLTDIGDYCVKVTLYARGLRSLTED